LEKLTAALGTAKRFLADRLYIDLLDEKLEEAQVVSPEEIPADQVDIHRTILLTDLDRKERAVYKLVFPHEARPDNSISVLTPLGSALLGSRMGEVVEIHAPSRTRRVRVDQIIERGHPIAA
jgi:regulator of nucleoside diphosphate kinase